MVTFSGHTTTPTSSRYYVGSFNTTPGELLSGCQTYLCTSSNKTLIFRSLAYILSSPSSLMSTKSSHLALHLARPERVFTSVYLDDLIIFGKSQKLTANHTK
ncbi:hypothetical protein V8B55DRAFT_1436951 [Mucor lusitanicus]|uniref:Uncharacterized protein n=1 Tax=Mucor lusitanicus CBS 277.49 TaxID=747725 RepID=A0A168GLR5_MUCCL|nr:hypothetical protein MUCCIDRAFT_115892 [Mucor lusitanicus CBS 277.49]